MGHRLTPSQQSARTLSDLVSTLRDSFPIVEADREKGADHLGDMIAHFLKIKAGYARWKNPPPQAVEVDSIIERLEGLRGDAAFVTVANDTADEDQFISFNLVPGEDLIIGYANQKHEDVATVLTKQVADALGYQMTEL